MGYNSLCLGCRFLCLGRSTYRRTLTLLLEFHLGRGQTAGITAGTILQVAVDVIFWFGESQLLNKGHLVLEVLQFHVEQFVHLLDDFAFRYQFTYEFGTLHPHHVERCLSGAVFANLRGIDMPPVVNGRVEHNLSLHAVACLKLGGKMHWVHHLGVYSQYDQQRK